MEWTILTFLALFILIDMIAWHFIFMRAVIRTSASKPKLEQYPSISVIRPIRGVDADQMENLRAALDNGYPGEIETLFVFDEESDPGVVNARAAVKEHRKNGLAGVARVLIAGPPPKGRTGKLNAMIYGSRLARGQLIAFGDSDTRPDKEVLRKCVEALVRGRQTNVGCTFAPVVVVGSMRNVGDVGYAMMLNSLYGPIAARAAARNRGELPFIMGQIMVFRREVLNAIGGVRCAAGQLVDDMYIGMCVNKAGYTNLLIDHPLYIVTGGIKFNEFLKIYRRWLMFWRNGLSIAFTWPAVLHAVRFFAALVLAGVACVNRDVSAAVLSLSALFIFGISSEKLHKRQGGPAIPMKLKWMLWGVLLSAPFILISMIKRDIDWRGRKYQLALTTRLRKG